MWPNQSPEPTAVPSSRSLGAKGNGAVSLRPQRCHDMDAPNETFAARTVIAIAVHVASRRRLSYFR